MSIQLRPLAEQIIPADEICHDNCLCGKLTDEKSFLYNWRKSISGKMALGTRMILHPVRQQTPEADQAFLTSQGQKANPNCRLHQEALGYQELDLQVQDHLSTTGQAKGATEQDMPRSPAKGMWTVVCILRTADISVHISCAWQRIIGI